MINPKHAVPLAKLIAIGAIKELSQEELNNEDYMKIFAIQSGDEETLLTFIDEIEDILQTARKELKK